MKEVIDGEASEADEFAQGAGGEFFVLRDGEVDANAIFDENQVAADLTDWFPTCFLKGIGGLFTGYVTQASHGCLYSHDERGLFGFFV